MLTLGCNFWAIEIMRRMKSGYSYNSILKNIPFHILAELKSIPILPVHPRTHLYRKYPPPQGNFSIKSYVVRSIRIASPRRI